jgi:hypothetical protein
MAKKKAVKKGSAEAKRRMAKVRSAKKTTRKVGRKKVTKTYTSDKQTPVEWTNSGGYLYKYNVKRDKKRTAQEPGKRISKEGNVYYEYRKNRSDKKGSLTGERHYDTNSHNYNFTISGINGAINKGKNYLLNNLRYLYGKYASDLISAKTLKEKKQIKKLMLETKKQINKLK